MRADPFYSENMLSRYIYTFPSMQNERPSFFFSIMRLVTTAVPAPTGAKVDERIGGLDDVTGHAHEEGMNSKTQRPEANLLESAYAALLVFDIAGKGLVRLG